MADRLPDSTLENAGFQVENAAGGIRGCDAIWPYDPDKAYFGMRRWAEVLLDALTRACAEPTEDTQAEIRSIIYLYRIEHLTPETCISQIEGLASRGVSAENKETNDG